MNITIVGNDLRTVALAKRLLKEGHRVSAVPGFTRSLLPRLESVPLEPGGDEGPLWQQVRRVDDILRVVRRLQPDLVVCPHVESSDAGLIDELKEGEAGECSVFGVSRGPSRIETSKAYGLSVARACGLRTPETEVVPDAYRRERALRDTSYLNKPLVVKADGLAGGRGTLLTRTREEFASALELLPPGDVLIQEYVYGQELALSLLCSGRDVTILNVNFEYKRAGDGDVGENTPGMGTLARSGAGLQHALVLLKNIKTILCALDYVGPVDISFMFDEVRREPVFLEFTARFGDPELSSELLLVDDLARLLTDVASGVEHEIAFRALPWAAGVVVRGGVHVLAESTETFSHDSMWSGGEMESCYSATGSSPARAIDEIYSKIRNSVSPKAVYRSDIGYDVGVRWQAFIRSLTECGGSGQTLQ